MSLGRFPCRERDQPRWSGRFQTNDVRGAVIGPEQLASRKMTESRTEAHSSNGGIAQQVTKVMGTR
jgi:hypothetical protein